MSLFERVKDNVNIAEVVERFGVKLNSKGVGICPFHSEKTGSFSVKRDSNSWKCFGCGEGGDAIDFVAKLKGVDGVDAAKMLAEMYGIETEDKPSKPKKFDVKGYINKCIADVSQTDYFAKRSLTAATVKKYFLGYDTFRKSVVIPYSSKLTYYQTRSIEDKKFFKPKTEDCGTEPLFNGEAMYKSKDPVFVVESPICALSIMQCGAAAIALCGIGNTNKLIKEVKSKKPTATLILSLDGDEPGRKASQDLANELYEQGVKFDVSDIYGKECKDPNELLMKDAKQLKSNVDVALRKARKKYMTDKDSFNAVELQAEKIDPPIWIVQDVLPTGLALLCAPSKIGKSWMMLQLCLNACEGKDFLDFKTNRAACLYYALEDSKSRLQDRMNKMLKGKAAPSNMHFVLRADSIATGLMEKMNEELKRYPDIKLIVVDTLQKVRDRAAKNETMYSIDYREMSGLKDFADKNKICLLLVHHLRKMADEADVFNMISGSTALMGAADSIFIISKKKRTDDNAIFAMTGRDIQQENLVIAFNKADFVWDVEGTAEDIAVRKARSDYENSDYVKVIKELIKRNPMNGWCGSAKDLLKAVNDITGKEVTDSPTAVGIHISKIEYRLYCDGIEHKASKSKSREHTFTRKISYKPMYPSTIFDGNDD